MDVEVDVEADVDVDEVVGVSVVDVAGVVVVAIVVVVDTGTEVVDAVAVAELLFAFDEQASINWDATTRTHHPSRCLMRVPSIRGV